MERALTGLARITNRSKSVKDLGALATQGTKDYPPDPTAYEILDDCGRGVSATVQRAVCKVHNDIVAIKRMNLESLNCDLEEIIHEAQTMKNYHHPNVLPLYCSFVSGQELWMVMPFISGGSVLHIMKYAHPDGLDEVMIATIMRDVLKALEYVHKQGGIHRDIKAGNILLDKDGHVFLGDFGVAASMERTGSWGHDKVARMTFVGTPCWMAPEVMEQSQGYDSSADIWSFGITLLEMAHGHAPFAKFPPMKVLLMTLQNPPPTLDDKGKKHFSKAMRDVVTRCLQKDARLRPTASQLLEHKFFKQARDDEYLARNLMAGLPSLQDRVQEIRQGKAATNAQDNDKNFARSQDEYKKGISAWNFDVAALKAQAAMEPDDDEPVLPTITETDETQEGTLSGLVASQAAAFMQSVQHQQQAGQEGTQQQQHAGLTVPSARQQATANGNGSSSAFASLLGQQQLLKEAGSLQAIPPVHHYTAQEGVSAAGSAEPSAAVAEHKHEGRASSSQQGPESAPLSPGNVSPSGLSREGSVQGPLAALASTPTTTKQKSKQLGRFQIYEPGNEPPPMSPSNIHGSSTSLPSEVALHTKSVPALPASDLGLGARASEDGARRELVILQGQESVFEDTITGEPKKKGRFLVVEQAGMSKVASSASLADSALLAASKSREGLLKDGTAVLLGKPPAGPVAAVAAAAAMVPVGTLLPRLLELMEHTAAQQGAMQRLVGALQDVERGKASLLLARTQSTRSLFSDVGAGGLLAGSASVAGAARAPYGSFSGMTEPVEGGAGGESLESLRTRLVELEADNLRLKARNQQLEALLGQLPLTSPGASQPPSALMSAAPSGIPPDGVVPGGGAAGAAGGVSSQPPSAQPGASPTVSPRDREEGKH